MQQCLSSDSFAHHVDGGPACGERTAIALVRERDTEVAVKILNI